MLFFIFLLTLHIFRKTSSTFFPLWKLQKCAFYLSFHSFLKFLSNILLVLYVGWIYGINSLYWFLKFYSQPSKSKCSWILTIFWFLNWFYIFDINNSWLKSAHVSVQAEWPTLLQLLVPTVHSIFSDFYLWTLYLSCLKQEQKSKDPLGKILLANGKM